MIGISLAKLPIMKCSKVILLKKISFRDKDIILNQSCF
jgi:hypothetical protein